MAKESENKQFLFVVFCDSFLRADALIKKHRKTGGY